MIRILVLAFFVLIPVVGAHSQSVFNQDRFCIGFWVDPPLDESADARYREIADAHFSVVIGGFGGGTIEQQLELCRKYDLKLIASARHGDIEGLADGPALWGYALQDEPSAHDFPTLRDRAAEVYRSHPGKLAYVNLFPDYANADQLGTETYEEHIEQFIEVVEPRVLSMDHYPRFAPDKDGRDNYCKNLAVMRTYAIKADIPFWNFFNAMPYGSHTDPTEAQMRWQVNASLAYGAKGVMYFCYFTPRGSIFQKGGAIIDRNGRPTRHYDEATRINARLKSLGPTLMKLRSSQVVRINEAKGDQPEAILVGMPITNIEREEVDPPHDYLIGAFTHEDGRRAVLLMNYRFAYTAWPTVQFDAALDDIVEISPVTGMEVPLIDDSPDMEGLQLSLGAGDARLFLLP